MMLRPRSPKYLSEWKDQELLLALRCSREARYFDVLFDRYLQLVYGMCLRLTKDQPLAKDLCMKTFYKAFQSWQTQDVDNLRAWLRAVTYNYWISHLRIEEKKKDAEQWVAIIEFSPFLRLGIEREDLMYRYMTEELAQIPGEQSTCIQYFYFEELSYREIASRCAQTEHWVKSQLQNGKRRLRRAITLRLAADDT